MTKRSISFILLTALLATSNLASDTFDQCKAAVVPFAGVLCLDVPSPVVSPNFKSFLVEREKEELLLLVYEITKENNAGILEREELLLKEIQGKNVLKVYETHRTETHCYQLVERVARTLETFIQSLREPTVAEVLYIFLNIVRAVREINAHNIVHGGLTTHNIFLTDTRTVKISEFFQSMVSGQSGYVGKVTPYTDSQFVLDLNNPRTFTEAVDVYALGVILFRMTQKGRFPFDRTNPIELTILYSIGNFEVDKGSDAWVVYLLAVCMVSNPTKRANLSYLTEIIEDYGYVESVHPVPYPFTISTKSDMPLWIREVVWEDINKAKDIFKSIVSHSSFEKPQEKEKEKRSYINEIFNNFKQFLPDPSKYFHKKDPTDQENDPNSADNNRFWWIYVVLLLLVLVLGFLFGRYLQKEGEKRAHADMEHQIQAIEENNI